VTINPKLNSIAPGTSLFGLQQGRIAPTGTLAVAHFIRSCAVRVRLFGLPGEQLAPFAIAPAEIHRPHGTDLHRVVLERSSGSDPYDLLKGANVLRAVDGTSVEVSSLWGENERAVLVFGRSFG
jgi:hypothetical protein